MPPQQGKVQERLYSKVLTGADLQKLANDIQSEVDRISSFPEEAEDPRVSVAIHRHEVISLVIYGDQNEHVLRDIAETVRDELLGKENITQVDIAGVRDLEISIEVAQEKLRAYHLTLEEVAQRVNAASVELAGGGVKTRSGEVLVRMKERKDYGREFSRIPIITGKDGSQTFLEDIASITDGFEDTGHYATYNGKRLSWSKSIGWGIKNSDSGCRHSKNISVTIAGKTASGNQNSCPERQIRRVSPASGYDA